LLSLIDDKDVSALQDYVAGVIEAVPQAPAFAQD
jgi:hypothetical protein